jgi:hypothetical protein
MIEVLEVSDTNGLDHSRWLSETVEAHLDAYPARHL